MWSWITETSATPLTAAGTLPSASHLTSSMFTVFIRRWRQPPTVLVTAE